MLKTRLKLLRKEKGKTQFDVAEETGLSRSAIGGYESGHRIPSYSAAKKLAEYYNVDFNYIYDESAETTPTIPSKMVADLFMEYGYDFDNLSQEDYYKVRKFIDYALRMIDVAKDN